MDELIWVRHVITTGFLEPALGYSAEGIVKLLRSGDATITSRHRVRLERDGRFIGVLREVDVISDGVAEVSLFDDAFNVKEGETNGNA